MRQALPIWYCLDYDTQVKLAKMLDEPDNIPPCLWKEWPGEKCEQQYCYLPKGHDGLHQAVARIFDTDKEFIKLRETARLMSQAPSRSRG